MSSAADLVTESATDLSESGSKRRIKTREKLYRMKKAITIEPLIAAYFLASVLCGPALSTLEYEKACKVNLNFNDTVCDTIINGEIEKHKSSLSLEEDEAINQLIADYEGSSILGPSIPSNYTATVESKKSEDYGRETNQIQITISYMHSWQIPIQNVVPLIMVLFLGSYSDRQHLRKPFLLLPIFGEFFGVAGCILCVIFMRQWPLEVLGVVQTVVPSLFGGPTMIVMAAFAYIADVTTKEARILRIGMLFFVLRVCQAIVQPFSGILFAAMGYTPLLCMAGGLFLIALCYGLFSVKEPKVPVALPNNRLLIDAFNPRNALETINLLLNGKNRILMALVILFFFIYSGVVTGEFGILYPYLQNLFHWRLPQFSVMLNVNTVVQLVGIVVGVPLFVKIAKLQDLTILMVALLDKIATNITFALAKTITGVYVAVFVGVITGIIPIVLRSATTKIVSEKDEGKAQALFGISEALGRAISAPLYNTVIYVNTLETFPSAAFVFGAILLAIFLCVAMWMHIKHGRVLKMEDESCDPENPVVMGDLPTTQASHVIK